MHTIIIIFARPELHLADTSVVNTEISTSVMVVPTTITTVRIRYTNIRKLNRVGLLTILYLRKRIVIYNIICYITTYITPAFNPKRMLCLILM